MNLAESFLVHFSKQLFHLSLQTHDMEQLRHDSRMTLHLSTQATEARLLHGLTVSSQDTLSSSRGHGEIGGYVGSCRKPVYRAPLYLTEHSLFHDRLPWGDKVLLSEWNSDLRSPNPASFPQSHTSSLSTRKGLEPIWTGPTPKCSWIHGPPPRSGSSEAFALGSRNYGHSHCCAPL